MTLGSSNTPIEGSEIDVASIVESAIEHISLDGSGNVGIPNGDLNLSDGVLEIDRPQGSNDALLRLTEDGYTNWTIGGYWGSNGNELQIKDDFDNVLVGFRHGGKSVFRHGDVELTSGNLVLESGNARIITDGTGSDNIGFHDAANAQDILTASEGGNVEIPNGDLTDGTNVIYDNSETHIPRARLDGNKITSVITTNTTTADEEILYVDTSGGPVTITLASADAIDGNEITIVAAGGSAETNPITIATEGAETIDGASTTTISKNYSAQAIASDGTNWFTTGAGGGATAISEVTIDANKDWQNFDISNVRRFAAEDGVINGKTLETGNSMTIEDDESMVVSESYTIDGDLTINGSGSLTVI